MMRGFIDESQWGEKNYLMAGWVGSAEVWQEFSEEWFSVVNARPSIAYFKHHEAKTQTEQFAGWTTQQANRKIMALAKVIGKHNVYGVVTGVNLVTFKSVYGKSVLPIRQLRTILKNAHPYCWCFHSLVGMVLQWQLNQIKSHERVDFVFDKQTGLFKESADFYRDFRQHLRPEMKAIAGAVTEDDDKRVAGLQAADLLAGQCVSNLILKKPELPLKSLIQCHNILTAPAYLPDMAGFSKLIELLNITWSTKILTDIKTKRDPLQKRPKGINKKTLGKSKAV